MPSSFDLIIKNGKCFVDGQLKKVDIGISNEIVKKIGNIRILLIKKFWMLLILQFYLES